MQETSRRHGQHVRARSNRDLSGDDDPDLLVRCGQVGASLFSRTFARLGAGSLAHLLADSARDPDLRSELTAALVEPQRKAVRRTLTKARDRGDLCPDLDLSLIVDALSSLVFYRQLFGPAPMNASEIEDAVATLLRGIATDYDDLVARSAQHTDEYEGAGHQRRR